LVNSYADFAPSKIFLTLDDNKLGPISELTNIANSVKELVTDGIAKYLPLSA
jgi:hypothetical protein